MDQDGQVRRAEPGGAEPGDRAEPGGDDRHGGQVVDDVVPAWVDRDVSIAHLFEHLHAAGTAAHGEVVAAHDDLPPADEPGAGHEVCRGEAVKPAVAVVPG